MTEYRNGPKKWAVICLIIAALGLIMIFYPIISEMDGFVGGFALIFAGIIVTLTFFISSIIFFIQARSLEKAIASEETFARWSYSKIEWKKYYELEYKRDRQDKRILFYTASGFSIFFALLFILFVDEPWGAIYGALGIILLTGVLQWYVPLMNLRRNQKYSGKALISKEGIYLNGMWYPNGRFGRIDGINLIDNNKTLSFQWSQFAMMGGKVPERNYFTIRVPVPEGEENKAQQILDYFSNN
ncbi:MAG: hypothetical protein GYA14_15595 [Ignavibacteria bacterium]|nr:hypothetical protein [Ignavibacteria bacterium]